jgi:hypothetical protein
MSPLSRPSWSRRFEDFYCRGCGGDEAFRSRPRGFFEKHVLPMLMLQPVRCERCDHRSYAWRTIPVMERVSAKPVQAADEMSAESNLNTGSRIA